MSQAKKKKKFRIAGSSACPAAVDARWFQIRRFGSTPGKGTVFLSPNNWLAWCQYIVIGWVSMWAYDMLSQ